MLGHRGPLPTDIPRVPSVDLESPFGRQMRETAPPACRYHRVYFSVENRDLDDSRHLAHETGISDPSASSG